MFWENNRFMDWLTKFSHMIVLSALWVKCRLPVITIGPATIALYYAAAKTIRCGIGYPSSTQSSYHVSLLLSTTFLFFSNSFLFEPLLSQWNYNITSPSAIVKRICSIFLHNFFPLYTLPVFPGFSLFFRS